MVLRFLFSLILFISCKIVFSQDTITEGPMLSISVGPSFQIVQTQINQESIQTTYNQSFMAYGSIEQPLKNGFNAEAGFGYQEFKNFDAFQSNFGLSYHFTNKKNGYKYINLHTGIAANLTNIQKGVYSSVFYNFDSTNITKWTDQGLRKNNILLYFGLSKDFRITKDIAIFASYRFYKGFSPLYGYKVLVTGSDNQSGQFTVNGSSHSILLGLKYNVTNQLNKTISKGHSYPASKNFAITLDNTLNFLYQYRYKNDTLQYKQSWITYLPQMGLDYYLNPKTFIQTRVGYQVYNTFSMRMDYLQLNLGLTKRFDLPNHINIFNIEGGLSSYFIAFTKGYPSESKYVNNIEQVTSHNTISYSPTDIGGEERTTYTQRTDTIALQTTTYGVSNRFNPGVYLGIAKDFKLSNLFSLSFAYRRQFGFNWFYEEHTQNTNINSSYFINEDSYREKINGNSSQIVISVKYQVK